MNNDKPSDTVEHNKLIFIWIDILGFSDAVENEKKYKEISSQLKRFHTIFNESGGKYSTDRISDGILLTIDINSYNNFLEDLKKIGECQFKFICETKQFIRGGMAIGTRFEDNPLVSNGLARAVKIESNFVNWPIIGTNDQTLKEIKDLFKINEADNNFKLCHSFNTRGENLYFIDFIIEDNNYYDLLGSRIDDFEDEKCVKIKHKYVWLIKYYLYKFQRTKVIKSLDGIIL